MKRVLITGITGQDGIFVTKEILNLYPNSKIYGITRSPNNTVFFNNLYSIGCKNIKNIYLNNVELLNENEIEKYLIDIQPDTIINLSGPSSVYESLNDNGKTKDKIITIFNNLVNSLIKANNFPTFFQASTSEMFGIENKGKLNENSNFNPNSPYAIAKLENHHKVKNLSEKYNWKIFSGIMFNHESQFRKQQYLFMKVINTVELIKKNKKKTLEIGSLNYIRDWSYADDIGKAIISILENGKSFDYVIGSGKGHKISQLLDIAFSYFDLEYKDFIVENRNLLRENDPIEIVSDPKKIFEDVNWKSEVNFEKLIHNCIELRT